MWCFQAKRRISAYLDDELAADQRRALEEHLGQCAGCEGELERLRAQSASLRQIEDAPPLPTDLWSFVERDLARAEQRPWHRRHRPLLVRTTAVAACVILGFMGGALWSWHEPRAHGGQPSPSQSEARLFAEAFDAPVFALGGEEGWSRCEAE
jgi:anti-sigma factor RsiW